MYVLFPPPPPLSSPPRFPFSFCPSTQLSIILFTLFYRGLRVWHLVRSRWTKAELGCLCPLWLPLHSLLLSFTFPLSPPLLLCSFSLPSSPLCLYTGLDEILIEFGWCGSTIGSPLNVNDGYNIYDENGNDQVNSDGVCPLLSFFLPFNHLSPSSLHSLVVPPHLPLPPSPSHPTFRWVGCSVSLQSEEVLGNPLQSSI